MRAAVLAMALALAPAGANAAEPPGASACSGCHTASRALDSAVPPIAGRPRDELAAALRAFRANERPSTVMGRLARGFDLAELDVLAAWFAADRLR